MSFLTRLIARFIRYGIVLAVQLGCGNSSAQSRVVEEANPIYRCPGPPLLYTDEISPGEASRRNCRKVEATQPSKVLDGLSSDQAKVCIFVANTGFDIASRKSRGWSKDEQIQHYRQASGDSDLMILINELLIHAYDPSVRTSNASIYRKSLLTAWKSKLQEISKEHR